MVRFDAPIRVLHVDDQLSLSQLVATYLERYDGDVDLEVVSVGSTAEAQQRLDGSRIDCIISDYEMPEADGLQLLEAVRSQYPDLPFILFTGKGSEEVARDAFRVGATDYMQKETGTDQYTVLAKRVHNVVLQYRAETASKRYGAAIEALENAMYVLDGDGRFTSVDDVFVETTAYDKDEILGTHISHVDDDGTMVQQFSQLMATDGPGTVQFEADIVTATDDRCRCRCHLTTHHFEGEGVGSVVGTLQVLTNHDARRSDVQYYDGLSDLILDTSTTLMSAEADEVDTKLRWTLQSIAEYIGAGRATVFSTDGTDNFPEGGVDVSVSLSDIEKTHEWCATDITPADESAEDCPDAEWWLDRFRRFENIRLETLSAIPPEASSLRTRYERQGVTSLVAVPLVSNWSLRGVLEFASHGEERSWSDREVRFIRTLGDLVAHTLERRRREREMARYKTIIETVPDGVFLLNESGRMTQVNDAFAASLGADVDELLGRPFLDLIDEGRVNPEIADEYVDGIRAMLSGERNKNSFEVKVPSQTTDGSRIYKAHTRLLPHGDGFRGTAGIARDVTDELKQREQLRQQNERLDKFASVISHDLKNPLNVAQGFLDVARETGDNSHLDRVENALDRIDHLVGDVLSLARQGQTVGEASKIDLAHVVMQAWQAVEAHDARLAVDDELGTVIADEIRLSQAIQNLLSNAIEHGGHDVTVSVGTLDDGQGFYVADDGPGIPARDRSAIFDHGHTTSERGTGFGLAIVRDIVEAHNWSISVAETSGGGARFDVQMMPPDTDSHALEAE